MAPSHRKLSQEDIAVAERLAKHRNDAKFSQQELANELGLTRSTFANYEYGRSPLPYQVAFLFCMQLGLNLRWLATGQEPRGHFVDPRTLPEVDYESVLQSSQRGNFLYVYNKHLAAALDKWAEQNPPEKLILESLYSPPDATIRRMSRAELLERIPEFTRWLVKAPTDSSRLEMARLIKYSVDTLIPKLEVDQIKQPRRPGEE